MDRKLLSQLKNWKDKSNRKPLILKGARQVGKTWLLKEFGRQCFSNTVYINFEKNESIISVFEGDLEPNNIIEALCVFFGKKFSATDTLIIFDEIQNAPKALTSLKYFAEEAAEYAICCAGSLLGIALHKDTSFPVGKVDFLELAPLDFEEFLIAQNEKTMVDYVKKSFSSKLLGFEEKLQKYLKQYYIVGGMPAAVQTWIDTHDFNEVEEIKQYILQSYNNDFSKHAERNIVEKIRHIWNAIPTQLAKENKKFIYGLVREGARAREYEEALLWLKDAGLIRIIYQITKPALPLKSYMELKNFKMYFLDLGLLFSLSNLPLETILSKCGLFEEFKGSLTEQYVLQELSASKISSEFFYWSSGNTAEIDYLFSYGGHIIPLEAKSHTNVHAKSLKEYIKKYNPTVAIRTSLLPIQQHENLLDIPLYMLHVLPSLLHKSFGIGNSPTDTTVQ